MNRSQFADRHPYWFVALLEITVIAVYLLAGTLAYFTNLSYQGIDSIAGVSGIANITL